MSLIAVILSLDGLGHTLHNKDKVRCLSVALAGFLFCDIIYDTRKYFLKFNWYNVFEKLTV